jgi:hypothetical protein
MMDIMDMPNNSRDLVRKKKKANAQDYNTDAPLAGGRMEINQGDIYWVKAKEPNTGDAGFTHPHVVIQEDVLNRSRINTVVVCALTTNLKRAK